MPNVTIYLDDGLAEQVRQAEVPISRVCQSALRVALATHDKSFTLNCPECGAYVAGFTRKDE